MLYEGSFEEIISTENLLLAWGEFCRGKRGAKDVQEFERNLADNLLALHSELASGAYRHGGYYQFRINDPKPRVIHKASVRDRLVHHAIYRKLYPFFDRKFIFDSYSCRMGKGTHRAMARFREFAHGLSQNNTKTVWVLKCDIRKFFDSIDHEVLIELLRRAVVDEDILKLLEGVVGSFHGSVVASTRSNPGNAKDGFRVKPGMTEGEGNKREGGLPLGNLTSQLLVNIYMTEFDQFVKHALKQKYYIRYADDFVFLSHERQKLGALIEPIAHFLHDRLHLQLHPDKLFLKTVASGVDFLGWVHFANHRVLRTAAKHRMFRTLIKKPEPAVFTSYNGLLQHGDAFQLREQIGNLRWLLGGECS